MRRKNCQSHEKDSGKNGGLDQILNLFSKYGRLAAFATIARLWRRKNFLITIAIGISAIVFLRLNKTMAATFATVVITGWNLSTARRA